MAGIYSVQEHEDLPTEFAHYGKLALPGVVFLWQPIDRRCGNCSRRDVSAKRGMGAAIEPVTHFQ